MLGLANPNPYPNLVGEHAADARPGEDADRVEAWLGLGLGLGFMCFLF